MKVNYTIESEKGFWIEDSFETSLVSEIPKAIERQMDKHPESIEGVSCNEWTRITITIDRKLI